MLTQEMELFSPKFLSCLGGVQDSLVVHWVGVMVALGDVRGSSVAQASKLAGKPGGLSQYRD